MKMTQIWYFVNADDNVYKSLKYVDNTNQLNNSIDFTLGHQAY